MLGFGPYSLDLGPKGDEALRVGWGGDVRTDGQIPPVFYRTSSPSGPGTLRQHVLIDEASSEHFLDEKIVCSDNCSPFCNEAKKLSDERCELINKIFSADGFFDQMEETRREKGVESKEYKLLLQVSDATKTYLDRVLKGNLVGLAADFKKTVPGEEINAIFDNNFGIIHVVACMECWEEKLRLKKMSNALILNVVLCNGYNEELFNVLEQVKVAKTSWRD